MTKQLPVQEDRQIEICSELVRLLRLQKHDFLNHFQVIHGLLQLGKTDRALKYIEELAKDPALIENTLREYKMENCVLREH